MKRSADEFYSSSVIHILTQIEMYAGKKKAEAEEECESLDDFLR
jgi:hypothetical protein